jgi:hypothetical protein
MKSGQSGYWYCVSPDQAMDDTGMDSFEATTHPFIVKIWLEETAEEAGQATWRGHITHVPSGERRYLKSLDEIAAFVAPYLEEMGVGLDTGGRIRRWLKRCSLCFTRRHWA